MRGAGRVVIGESEGGVGVCDGGEDTDISRTQVLEMGEGQGCADSKRGSRSKATRSEKAIFFKIFSSFLK